MMLVVSILPWLWRLAWLCMLGFPAKVPLPVDQISGMYGTIAFFFIGLPGLAVTVVGLTRLCSQRDARGSPVPGDDVMYDHDRAIKTPNQSLDQTADRIRR